MSLLTVYLIRNDAGNYFTGDLWGGGKYAVFSPDRRAAFEMSAEEVISEITMPYMPHGVKVEESHAEHWANLLIRKTLGVSRK